MQKIYFTKTQDAPRYKQPTTNDVYKQLQTKALMNDFSPAVNTLVQVKQGLNIFAESKENLSVLWKTSDDVGAKIQKICSADSDEELFERG